MAKVKHIIWDWNGTILNDIEIVVDSVNETLRRVSLQEIDLETYRETFRHPIQGFYEEHGFDFSKTDLLTMCNWYFDYYENQLLQNGRVHDGIEELLEDLSERGLQHSILSAHKHDLLTATVERMDIGRHFVDVVGAKNEDVSGKLEEGREHIAQLGLAGEELLLIGDTNHDVDVAEALGIDCMLISHGFQSRARLEAHGIHVCDDLAELRQELYRRLGS